MISKEEFAERFAKVYKTAKMRDRGSIKWTAMMLPEHTTQLREDKANYNKVERPQLDDSDMDYIHDEINRAITSKSEVIIKLWIDGEFIYYSGTINEVNLIKRFLKLEVLSNIEKLNLDQIVGIQLEG